MRKRAGRMTAMSTIITGVNMTGRSTGRRARSGVMIHVGG